MPETIQKVIDEAKKESSYGFELPVMNEILKQSENNGKLTWTNKQITSCEFCDKKRDYYRYPRSSRYHSKGNKNFDKPIYYSGIKFNEGFVTLKGYGDMCSECCSKHKVKERLIDYIIEHDLKIQVMKNDYKPGRYLRDDIRICYDCGEEMLESQMSKEMTLMGNGYYPSGCPKCGAKSLPFGKSHKTTSKFGYIHNPESLEEVVEMKKLVDEYNKGKQEEEKFWFNQSSNSISSFFVKEKKWSNGNREVIQFGTSSKKFTVGYFYKDKCDEFTEVLLKHGYIENQN
ncbi:hypothetical protein [Paenibacillus sp. XY044]|uniref:hypothetical protein n=1 Tax=Paenibacillus sp. XY044 TaxID=2026089 RepID=UPI0015C64418|nr:hypothetical protein [Paenibacillus sp. XY044]